MPTHFLLDRFAAADAVVHGHRARERRRGEPAENGRAFVLADPPAGRVLRGPLPRFGRRRHPTVASIPTRPAAAMRGRGHADRSPVRRSAPPGAMTSRYALGRAGRGAVELEELGFDERSRPCASRRLSPPLPLRLRREDGRPRRARPPPSARRRDRSRVVLADRRGRAAGRLPGRADRSRLRSHCDRAPRSLRVPGVPTPAARARRPRSSCPGARPGSDRRARGGSRRTRRAPSPRWSSQSGVPLVEAGACRLRDRVVGRVAEQEVAEAESVLALERGPVGPDRTPCARVRSAARSVRSSGVSACTAPRWKTSPSTAAASSTVRSSASSWSRRAASSAWIVGGTPTCSSLDDSQHRRELLDEERVAARRPRRSARDTAASGSRSPSRASISSLRLLARERLEPQRRRASPAAGRAAPGGPCRAAGSARRDETNATCSIRSSSASSAQWMSSKTSTSGRSRAAASTYFRNAHASSSVEAAPAVVEQRRGAAVRCRRSSRAGQPRAA